jgi:undecaprenyl-diphosphatase
MILVQLLLVWGVKTEAPWLATLDSGSARAINSFGEANPQFPRYMYWLTAALLTKTLPFLMILVWCWFSSNERPEADRLRAQIAAGVAASLASICLAMAVQKFIGHRERPFYQSEYSFMEFFNGAPQRDISSFPSDTCALVFGLSMVAFIYSRKAGLFAFGWAIFAVAVPRVLTGIHYVSDVLFSALNGVLLVILVTAVLAPLIRSSSLPQRLERHRALVYALAFGLLFEVGRLGGDLRPLLTGILKAL